MRLPSRSSSAVWRTVQAILFLLSLSASGFTPSRVRQCPTTTTFLRATTNPQENNETLWRALLRNLAQLSLKDYQKVLDVWKTNEADRMVERSIARMQGTDPVYLRPMDAPTIGPLGRFEKNAVEWLAQVMAEEGARAEKIITLNGKVVRPLEADELGPLGTIERKVVDFIQTIRKSEQERVRTKTLRPKDLEESVRGPLGKWENTLVGILEELQSSEVLRFEQSKTRGIVRPIDVPGPLGELELAVSRIFDSEKARARQRESNQGKRVRPKDASKPGPLGQIELQASNILDQVRNEERERLKNLQKVLFQNRPMEMARDSPLGFLEALIVGLLRAPQLMVSTLQRVKELLQSQPLDPSDQEFLQAPSKSKNNSKPEKKRR